ncbi:hypothetical protein ABG79_01734 [Caloramator mitchellensis]|uniref:Uncharacterized protein n=1 Tax=Caloramator mitchellensis TaxID=908809 RepID=A0A0R3JW25_CALMK|nr:hypothetical protein [Caloramator mitchellensis]KRQ86525.1 hypothetical protein ABG79_01734 [Caloramator mitchellensis]
MNTRKLTLNGLIAAATLVVLYIGVMTKSKLSFLALASFGLSIPVLVSGIGMAALTIVAVDILSFLLIPNINYTIAFLPISFYPVVKSFAEGKKLHWVIKYGYFNLSMILIYLFAKTTLAEGIFISNNTVLAIVFLASQVVFYLYDYVFTQVVYYIVKRVRIGM